jgi:hypothetical protein
MIGDQLVKKAQRSLEREKQANLLIKMQTQKDKEFQLKERERQRKQEQMAKKQERDEWNKLFEYNNNKELNNKLQWKQKFENLYD